MGDNLFTLMIAAAVNIFIIILLFIAAKALKKYADRLFNRQEQMANDCLLRRGVFRHGQSNLAPSPANDSLSNGTPGDPAASAASSSSSSSPPPEYTDIEFKVKPSYYHLPSYEDAVKLEEGKTLSDSAGDDI